MVIWSGICRVRCYSFGEQLPGSKKGHCLDPASLLLPSWDQVAWKTGMHGAVIDSAHAWLISKDQNIYTCNYVMYCSDKNKSAFIFF